METLTTRNKAEARRIESWVQRQIADLGTTRIAEVAGVNKSTVSRWRENLVPNMSLRVSFSYTQSTTVVLFHQTKMVVD